MSSNGIDISSIAALQKRVKDWSDFLAEGGVQDPELQSQVRTGIEELRKVLAECWKAQAVSPAAASQILNLERRLTQMNEEARMQVVGKLPGTPARMI